MANTYKGRYTVKNKDKYRGDPTSVIYRSMWERHAFAWCDQNTAIKGWSSEEVVVPYLYEVTGRKHRYFTDLLIEFNDNSTLLVEIKPEYQTKPPTGKKTKRFIQEAMTYVKNQNKWQAADNYAKQRGWNFVIWTEKELTSLGIMPKPPKKLKPLKPLKKPRKR